MCTLNIWWGAIPDSATRSTLSSPCLSKNFMRRCSVAFGGGRFLLASFIYAVFESLLPSGSSQYGPPLCHEMPWSEQIFTNTVEPLAARATVSAQETVCGHASSSAALISSMTSNPLREFLLGIAFFSLASALLSSSRTDASHPCNLSETSSDI